MRATLGVMLVLLMVTAIPAFGQIPHQLSYQGVLCDTLGNAKPDGQYTITFRLYDVANGGSALWTQQKTLMVKRGLFSTMLGDQVVLDPSIKFDKPYWLSIQVASDPELSPRIELTAVGYALNAVRSDTAKYALSAPLQPSVDSARIAWTVPNGSLTAGKIASGQVVKSVNALKDNVRLVAGPNVTITTGGDSVKVEAASGPGGTITGVNTNGGLQGGGNSGSVTVGIANLGVTNGKLAAASVSADKLSFPITATMNPGSAAIDITTNNAATALYGHSLGFGGVGVWGRGETSGIGVRGEAGAGGYGGYFTGQTGVYSYSPNHVGMTGASNGPVGVYGISTDQGGIGANGYCHWGTGVSGSTDTIVGFGGYFSNSAGTSSSWSHGVAVGGFTSSGSTSSTHPQGMFFNGAGEFSGPNGLIGAASDADGYGILGISSLNGSAIVALKLGGGGNALSVSNSGTDAAVSIVNGSSSTSYGLAVENYSSNVAASIANYGTGTASHIYNAGTGTDGLDVDNHGSGRGLYVANNGTGNSTYFAQLGSGGYNDAFVFSTVANGDALNVYDSGTGHAIYVSNSGGGPAAYFHGDVSVNGTLSKSGGSFKIDHPLDPNRKYLQHSFVESPDMMNVYNGNVATDGNGDATVALPEYFSTLNRDYRYQLTVIGQFAQAIVKDEITGDRFTIKTDKPNVKVSWQVTGIRQDPWANANRIQVEVSKSGKEVGKYLYPQGYGQPESSGLDYERVQAARNAMLKQEPPPKEQAPVIQVGGSRGTPSAPPRRPQPVPGPKGLGER